MNKEKMLEFLSAAIDNGAKIEITFHGLETSRNDAFKIAKEFGQIVNGNVRIAKGEKYKWFKVDNGQFQLDHFYNQANRYLKEDVRLDGMPDEVNKGA